MFIPRDLRSGFRILSQAPGFSSVAILTLALGIGVNAAIFSAVYAVLLAPPPYPSGARLVNVWETTSGQKIPVSWNNFEQWRRHNHTFEEMAGCETAELTLSEAGGAVVSHAGIVSAGFFSLTGWRTVAGRVFSDNDDRPGAAPVAVISGEFGARLPGGVQGAVGAILRLDGKAYQVIGVLPPGVHFFDEPIDLYLAAGARDGAAVKRDEHGRMVLLGLLKRGVMPTAAQADLDRIMERRAGNHPGPEKDHRAAVEWLSEAGRPEARRTLLLLMGAVMLVLAIACANVASLLLARSAARSREMAIRAAIGAGRSRLARQLLTENLVIAVSGGGLGLLLAELCLRALALPGYEMPRLRDAGLNGPVLAFTALITLLTGALASLAPLWHANRLDVTTALKKGSPGAGAGRRGQALRGSLVVAEVAATVILSFACVLLLRSLVLAQGSDPGFQSAGVLALELRLPPTRYPKPEGVLRFYKTLRERLASQPGVESVSAVNCPPSTGGCARGWYSVVGLPAPAPADVPLTLLTTAAPRYFQTMRMHLLAGRGFTDADRDGVVVINEKIARRWWPTAPRMAVGQRIKFGGPYMEGPTEQIVGVVGDVAQSGLDEAPAAEIYAPFTGSAAMVVMIRTGGQPTGLIPMVRRELTSVDPDVAVQSLRPFSEWMAETLQRRRFSSLLFAAFASLALLLSAVGICGILSQWVAEREKELAIRMALGARRPRIVRLVGGQALRLVSLGIVAGVAGAAGASRWLESMVFGIAAMNPALLGAAVLAVSGIAVAGAAVPMWRASRLEAMRKLREC